MPAIDTEPNSKAEWERLRESVPHVGRSWA
jgi:hypothetical protein